MAYRNTLNSLVTTRGKSDSGGGSTSYSKFGRVVDIILDENHSKYKEKGGGIAINGVFYKPFTINNTEILPGDLPFAFQDSAHIKTVPIIGEIVEVVTMPNLAFTTSEKRNKEYYTRIVNTWNNPNSGAYPDLVNNPDIDITTRGTFKELPTVNPIRSAPGDIQIEGRQGQSIRFTGGKGTGNSFVDDTNIGKPVIIISNGQSETDNGFTTLAESIDDDSCSIYMTSDHQINLTPASIKREAFDENPTESNQFKGNQIILNGGRLFFNAKESDIQLSSKSSIGLNTEGSINIDGSSYLCMDAPIMYLGVKARTASDNFREPVVLGNQLEGFLENLLNMLEGMANDMASARTSDNKPIPKINKRGVQAKPVIQALKRRINPNGQSSLKSKKVFTE